MVERVVLGGLLLSFAIGWVGVIAILFFGWEPGFLVAAVLGGLFGSSLVNVPLLIHSWWKYR